MKFYLLICAFLGGIMSIQAQTIIFSENFEAATLPLGWSTQQQTGSTGWQIGNSSTQSSSFFNIPTHSSFVTSNDDLCNCDMSNDLLISPAIDLSTAFMPELTFSAFYNGTYGSVGSILASTDNIVWTTLQNIPSSSTWETHTINLTQYVGQSTLYLAFKHNDNGQWATGVAIDDVFITQPIFVGNTILFEGFNSCAFPTGWGKFELQGSVGFEIGTADSLSGGGLDIPPHSGCVAGINDAKHDTIGGTANIVDDYLHTPKLDLSNYSAVFLDYDTWVSDGRFYMDALVSTDSINWTYIKGLYSGDDDWTSFTVDLTPWAGQSKVYVGFRGRDFNFASAQGAGAIDNIHIYEPPARDLNFVYVFPYEYMEVGKSAIRGKIENLGGDTIHSVDIHWQANNGPVHSQTLTGLSYIPLTTNLFTLNDSLEINSTGIHNLKVWISNPNGLSDLNLSNDSIIKNINALPYLPEKRVVFEKHTATWCSSCPGGTDSMIAFSNRNPRAIIATVHGSDIMAYTEGNIMAWGLKRFGFPSLTIDRFKYSSFIDIWFSPYNEIDPFYFDRRDLVEPIEITFLQKSYNSLTRELTIEVNAEFFVDYPNDDLRLNILVTEDSISNEFDPNYNQAYATTFPYYHRHVARATLDGAWGVQGSLPASVTVGNYSKLFTWVVPDSFNLDHLEIIGMVHRYSDDRLNRPILNANTIGFWDGLSPTSLTQVNPTISPNINIYPNPFSDNLAVAFNLETATNVSIEVIDVIGQRVGSFSSKLMAAGRQLIKMEKYMNSDLLQEGIYFINVQLGNNQFTKELIYEK